MRKLPITLLIAAIFVFMLTTRAAAQTSIAVNISRATLAWNWTQGTGGAAAAFTMRCGQDPAALNTVTPIPDPAARSIPLKSAIAGVGNWTCGVTASNEFGESPLSNLVTFHAGTVPDAPQDLQLLAQ